MAGAHALVMGREGAVQGERPMEEPGDGQLFEVAEAVQARAHAPYSRFPVGAALLAEDGRVFAGCNVENASFGLTLCAERAALVAAVAAGARRFLKVAIVTPADGPVSPCGACRQVLAEFAPGLVVLSRGRSGEVARWRLDALLPDAMGSGDLPGRDG